MLDFYSLPISQVKGSQVQCLVNRNILVCVCVYVQAYEGHWFISLFNAMCFTL